MEQTYLPLEEGVRRPADGPGGASERVGDRERPTDASVSRLGTLLSPTKQRRAFEHVQDALVPRMDQVSRPLADRRRQAVDDGPPRPRRRHSRATAWDTNCMRPGMRQILHLGSCSGFIKFGSGFDSRRLHSLCRKVLEIRDLRKRGARESIPCPLSLSVRRQSH